MDVFTFGGYLSMSGLVSALSEVENSFVDDGGAVYGIFGLWRGLANFVGLGSTFVCPSVCFGQFRGTTPINI